jgi:integrase
VLTREHVIMRVKLTAAVVAKLPVPQNGREIYWDTSTPGFGLQIMATGHRGWVVQYRSGGHSRRLSLSGVLTIEAARREARGLLGDVARGHDPLGERRKAAAAVKDSFRAIANEYFKREGRKLRTLNKRRRRLERLVYPQFGGRQIETIRRSDINRLLDDIDDNSGPVAADATLAILRRIMNWHASRSDDFRSPIVRGMARSSPRQRDRKRILSDDELRAVWRAAEATPGPYGVLVQFLLLTAVRRDEAGRLCRREISGDVWTIPGGRYKSGSDHTVPLSAAAMTVLHTMPNLGDFVFSGDGRRPIGSHTERKKKLDADSGVTGWVLHDLRRTARSLMSRAGVPADHAERCLGHVIGGVRGIYDRHSFADEKRQAFEALATLIGKLTCNKT